MAFSDDGSYIPDQPATIMGPGGSLSPEEEQDPLFKFRTPEWKNLARSEPARAYLQFQRAMIKHPDWQKMDYAGKQKVAKALTGFDPYEIIKSEGFGALNPNDRADLFNLTMDGNPDWEQLPREARLYLRSITPGLEHYSPGAQDALRRKQNEAVGRATAEKMAEVKAIEDDAEKKEFVTQRAKEVSDLYDIMGDIDFLGGTTIDRMQKFNKWAETSTMWQGIEDLEEKRRFREDIIHNSKLPAPYRENAIQQGPEGAWEMALNLKKRVELNIKRDWTALMAQHTMQDDPEYVKEQARINDELKATPYHEATGRISDGVAETGDFWAWLKGTHDVKDSLIWAAEIGLESMGQYAGTGLPLTAAAGAIATLTGGAATPLVAGGAAAGSFVMEFAPSFYDSLEKQGVDITDPDALMKALKNPTLMKNARNYATKRGMSVAGFDMLGVLLIGRLGSIRGSLKAAGRLGTIKQGLKEVGVGAVTGMLGEAGAQYWTEHGIVDPLGIFAEGFLEVPTSIVESTATRSPQVYKRLRNFRIEMPGEQYARATAEGLGSFGREMGQQDLAPFTLEVVPGTEGQQLRGRQTHVKSPAFESPVKSVIDLLSEEEQARFYERANKRLDARMKEYMRENGIDNDPGLIPENDFAAIANQVLAEELNATKEAAEASHGSFESWLRGVQKQQAEANKVPRLSMTQWLNIVNETSDLDELAQIEEDVQNAPKLSNERRTRVFDAIANRRRELEAGPRIMEDEEADVEEAAPETEAQPESPERAPEAPVTPRVLIDEELQQEADQEPPPPSQAAKPGTPREVPRLNRGHWLKLVKGAESQEELEMIANDLERGSENITDKSRSDVREAINERMRDLRPPIPTPGTPEWDEHVEANRPALEARAEELGTTVEEMIAKENEEANERRFGEKAREAGMTVPEYIAKVREENAQRAAESNEEMRRKYEERQARIAAEPEEDIKPAPDVVEEEAEPEYVYTPEQAERIDELKSDMNEAWAKANEAEFESKEQEKWLEKFAALEREYNEIQAAARKPVKKKKAKPKAEAAPEVAPEAPERQPREELREPSMVNAKDYKDIIREATTVDELKDSRMSSSTTTIP
jgi:hypothetical protein